MNPATNAAQQMNDAQLFQAARALNAELSSFMASGRPATCAHEGMLETVTACTDELVARGYVRGAKADGSDLPRDVMIEDGIRYSIAVRVF